MASYFDVQTESRKLDLAVLIYRLESAKTLEEHCAVLSECERIHDIEDLLAKMPSERVIRYYKAKEHKVPPQQKSSQKVIGLKICELIEEMEMAESQEQRQRIIERCEQFPNFDELLLEELPGKWLHRYLEALKRELPLTLSMIDFKPSSLSTTSEFSPQMLNHVNPSSHSNSNFGVVQIPLPATVDGVNLLFKAEDTKIPFEHSFQKQLKATTRTGTNMFGRQYSPGIPLRMELRKQIIELAEAGVKVNAIAKELCLSHGCVSKILKRYALTGQISAPSHGRNSSILLVNTSSNNNTQGYEMPSSSSTEFGEQKPINSDEQQQNF